MTRQTEQYLRNYLTKKALTMAAEQEVREAAHLVWNTKPFSNLLPPNVLDDRIKRERYAIAMQGQLRAEEAQAFDAYMEHLQSLS